LSPVLEKIIAAFGAEVVSTHSDFGDDTALVRRDRIVEILTFLRDDPELLFEVVYHLYSLEKKHRVRIKVRLPDDDPALDSAVSVWPTLNWYEREAYDMYGIVFRGHPKLTRILMYEGFDGHPLRKDYPKEKRQPTIGPED
jgi:NADH-quinone oxidoreductase subunit C